MNADTFVTILVTWGFGVFILLVVWLAVMFIQDVTQDYSAIRRNFPVIGRLRYMLEKQGEFLRQYYFALDREEMPFNRSSRSWVYRTAKGDKSTIGFGSTNDLREPGSIIFVNDPLPNVEHDPLCQLPMIIGEHCQFPFQPKRIVNISGMSFGALSYRAVSALSIGAELSGVWMNTGEGGLSAYHEAGQCDVIFQIGTAKFGVCHADGSLDEDKLRIMGEKTCIKAFEVKLSQGAKPGKGGILPGKKVTQEIADIRGVVVGEDAMSPSTHIDIHSHEELLDFIERVRQITGKPVGIKTALGSDKFPKQLVNAILDRGKQSAPDFFTVDGGEGGSGAAPQELADHVGLPLAEALPMLVNTLLAAGLKDRIAVVASGKLVTSDKAAWALCVGADYVTTARGFLFALGCIQATQCHKDTCPTGITTQDPRYQKGLIVEVKKQRVANYACEINRALEMLAESCGLSCPSDFRREHVRIVQQAGKSIPLDELYPYPNE